jgi:hypothetical protein
MPLEMTLEAARQFEAGAPTPAELLDAAGRKRLRDRQRMAQKRDNERQSRDMSDKDDSRATQATIGDYGATVAPVSRPRIDNILPTEVTGLSVAVAETRKPARVDDWPEGDANIHAMALVAIAGTSRLDPARKHQLVLTVGRLAAWRRDGASWEHDVIPTVTTLTRKTGPPIASWKYFDSAIAQSIADNRQALEIPEAANVPPSPQIKPR